MIIKVLKWIKVQKLIKVLKKNKCKTESINFKTFLNSSLKQIENSQNVGQSSSHW